MKFHIAKSSLVRAVSSTARATKEKSTLPILSNLVIRTDGDRVRFSGTNLTIGVTTSAEASIEQEGGVCVNAKSLDKIASALPDGDVAFVVGKNSSCELRVGKVRFKLPGMPADDYPALPTSNSPRSTIDSRSLARIISATKYAACNDDTRPHLCGVMLDATQAHEALIVAVSTDGHRLAVATAEPGECPKLEVLIPNHGIPEVLALCEQSSEVKLVRSGDLLFAEAGDVAVSIKLADGAYPPWRRVEPANNRNIVTVSRESLIDAVKRVSLMTDGKVSGVRMVIESQRMVVSCENPDAGESEEEIDCDLRGEQVVIAASARYLLEALKSLPNDDIAMHLDGKQDAILITGADGREVRATVMPLRA